jgi:hypothetical protein
MLHVKSHCDPSHVAVAFAGAMHAPHALPQLATLVLLTHDEPHRWKPVLQTMSHEFVVVEQMAVAFAGAGHGVQLAPHELASLFATHTPLQR